MENISNVASVLAGVVLALTVLIYIKNKIHQLPADVAKREEADKMWLYTVDTRMQKIQFPFVLTVVSLAIAVVALFDGFSVGFSTTHIILIAVGTFCGVVSAVSLNKNFVRLNSTATVLESLPKVRGRSIGNAFYLIITTFFITFLFVALVAFTLGGLK